MGKMSTVEMQIAERARQYTDAPLTNLHQFIDLPLLEASFALPEQERGKRIDQETWQDTNSQKRNAYLPC